MSEENKDKKGFKVADKRRFDSGGEERPAAAKSDTKPDFEVKSEPYEPKVEAAEQEITFSSFIMSLGTQTLMLLGQLPAPDGVEMPIDKRAAKQTIDILTILEQKTKGNLDPGEAHLMEEMLHSLRMIFIKAN